MTRRAAPSLLVALLLATPVAAGPIFTNGVDAFWSDEPFIVRSFHTDWVEPGAILENEYAGFAWEEQGEHGRWLARRVMPAMGCGGNQDDAYRGDWQDLTALVAQLARHCLDVTPQPPCLDCVVIPQCHSDCEPTTVPEPATWLLFGAALIHRLRQAATR